MKPKYRNNSKEVETLRNELFNLVYNRDLIGEIMWVIYTGLLLTSIIQLNITTMKCKPNLDVMEEKYSEFLKKTEDANAKKEKASETVYTV